MTLPLNIDIARSLMVARWKQTLVAAVGVTFSITMFIALLGFMTGLNDLLDGLILNRTAHVLLYQEVKPSAVLPIDRAVEFSGYHHVVHSIRATQARPDVLNSLAIMQNLKKDARVMGVSPKVSAQAFFNSGNVDITGVINGIDVEAEVALFRFSDYVVRGDYLNLKNIPNTIILGKPLAEKLMVQLNDLVQLTTPQGEQFNLKVVGLYQSGLQEFDKTQAFASLLTVQKLLGKSPSYITEIGVKTTNLETAPALAKEFAAVYKTDAIDIQRANAQFETGSFVRTIIAFAVGITLLIVAGFGIYNILNMMIYEKMDSIAILKATGFAGRDVQLIFIFIAMSIGLFGGLFGLLFGFLLSVLIDQIPFVTEALPTIKTYPINYNATYYAIGIVFSLITTFFAGFFPARKASKVDPVIIIRGK